MLLYCGVDCVRSVCGAKGTHIVGRAWGFSQREMLGERLIPSRVRLYPAPWLSGHAGAAGASHVVFDRAHPYLVRADLRA